MDLTQILALAAIVLGSGSTIGVVAVAIINKYGKGETGRQNEVALGVSILEKQIERTDKERDQWKDIESYLRDELRKTEADRDRVRDLLQKAQHQIRDLLNERASLLERQRLLSNKVANGEKITLTDITGQLDLDNEIEDLEDTYMN